MWLTCDLSPSSFLSLSLSPLVFPNSLTHTNGQQHSTRFIPKLPSFNVWPYKRGARESYLSLCYSPPKRCSISVILKKQPNTQTKKEPTSPQTKKLFLHKKMFFKVLASPIYQKHTHTKTKKLGTKPSQSTWKRIFSKTRERERKRDETKELPSLFLSLEFFPSPLFFCLSSFCQEGEIYNNKKSKTYKQQEKKKSTTIEEKRSFKWCQRKEKKAIRERGP